MKKMQRVWVEGRSKPFVLVGPPWLKKNDVIHHGVHCYVVKKARFEEGIEIKFPARGKAGEPRSTK